jgi:hypothetical protein
MATPATYEINGRQYVGIDTGGGKAINTSKNRGVYVAFALPCRELKVTLTAPTKMIHVQR